VTVAELLAALTEYPPDMPVKVYGGDDDGDWSEVEFHVDKDGALLLW